MSKKKKFKKFSKAELLEEIKKSAEKQEDKIVFEQVEKTDSSKNITPKSFISPTASLTETAYVKNDLKRVALVLSFVLVILFVSIYLDKKTSMFNNFTNSLVKVLNLNQ